MSLAPILVVIGGALLATLASAADGALIAVERAVTEIDGEAVVASRAERTHRALSTARVIGYVATGAALARAATLGDRTLPGRVAVAVLAALALVALSEGAARAIGFALGRRAGAALAPFTAVVGALLGPVIAIGTRLEDALYRLAPPAAVGTEEREASAEQFREVVAAEADVTGRGEQLIAGVFSLGETEVHDVMVPRVDIVGIEGATPWSEVVDRVRSSEHSRFPVFDETLDNVLGILYAKDMLTAVIADAEPEAGWRSLMRPARFIPTSKTIDAQLRDFKQSRTHIAIVSDEYGGTAGLVTIEDILEEIVGDIRDEYDEAEPDVEREGDSRFWVHGRLGVDDLRELLGTDFDTDDVSTVGGLAYALFGRVPRAGDSMVRDGYRIVVERVRRRRVERVYFERLEPVGSPETE